MAEGSEQLVVAEDRLSLTEIISTVDEQLQIIRGAVVEMLDAYKREDSRMKNEAGERLNNAINVACNMVQYLENKQQNGYPLSKRESSLFKRVKKTITGVVIATIKHFADSDMTRLLRSLDATIESYRKIVGVELDSEVTDSEIMAIQTRVIKIDSSAETAFRELFVRDLQGHIRRGVNEVTESKLRDERSDTLLGEYGFITRTSGERHLAEIVKDTHENVAESDKGFALLFIDIDKFKWCNDLSEDGHDSGDKMLRLIARAIARGVDKRLRKSDVRIRWGGDELVIGLRDVTPQEALSIVAQVQAEVSKIGVEELITDEYDQKFRTEFAKVLEARQEAGLLGYASFSGGLVMFRGGRDYDLTSFSEATGDIDFKAAMLAMLNVADKGLFNAKERGGRDSIVMVRDKQVRMTEAGNSGLVESDEVIGVVGEQGNYEPERN